MKKYMIILKEEVKENQEVLLEIMYILEYNMITILNTLQET